MSEFKVGDRVREKKTGDLGTITSWFRDASWWVKWDKFENESWIDEDKVDLVIEDEKISSVDQAIQFLLDAGFKVTLEKA